MSWIKFDCSTPEKPEVLAITLALGWDDPDLTVGKLLKVWRWFDQHSTEGNARNVTSSLLDRIIGVTGITQAMVNCGWMIVTDDGLQLPGFQIHNGKTAKDRLLTAKRVANTRGKQQAGAKPPQSNGGCNDSDVTSALPKEDKNREDKNREELTNQTADSETWSDELTFWSVVCNSLKKVGMQPEGKPIDFESATPSKATASDFVEAYRQALKSAARPHLPYLYPIVRRLVDDRCKPRIETEKERILRELNARKQPLDTFQGVTIDV